MFPFARFGMVTADTDVEELLNLVVSVGKDFEENSKVLESMTEIVKKGTNLAELKACYSLSTVRAGGYYLLLCELINHV